MEAQPVTTLRRRYENIDGQNPPLRYKILGWMHSFNSEGRGSFDSRTVHNFGSISLQMESLKIDEESRKRSINSMFDNSKNLKNSNSHAYVQENKSSAVTRQ